MNWTAYLFEKVESPDTLQMIFRGAIVFIASLVILRAGARRAFGNGTSMDNIVVIILGGILSRVVTGAAAFFPVMGAVITIVILHRVIAWLSLHRSFGKLINRSSKELYAEGKWNKENIKQTLTNREDIEESIRLQIYSEDIDDVKKIFIERSGLLSVIKKEKKVRL